MLLRYVKVWAAVVVVCFGIATVGVSVSVLAEQRDAAAREPTFPPDVHPESRSRLSLKRSPPSQPREGDRDLYGRTLSPEGTGPGHIVRHGAGFDSLIGSVGQPLVELSLLLTARALDSQYAWTLGEVIARQDGLSEEVIDVVRNEGVTTGLEEQFAVLIEFARELFDDRNVSPETYQRAVNLFGE